MTPESVLVCIAWPYANAEIHQGNVTGSHLPGDIFARYHRLRGNKVLMVSGSDAHGTPVTVKAEELNRPIEEVLNYYHRRFLDLFLQLGISYDLFTTTHTENHFSVAQDLFSRLLANGYLTTKVTEQMYSPAADKFLPDRYVEGTCPNCGYTGARGDQCDNCNTLFQSAAELLEPRSRLDKSAMELRPTEHYFLDLPQLAEDGVAAWLNDPAKEGIWRTHVLNFSRNWISEGLLERAITRDMDWGVPVPVSRAGFERKVMYVWFEAVIGYLSATIEWSSLDPEATERWKQYWYNPSAKIYHFIGKDNIPFHTLFWPSQLLGARGFRHEQESAELTLPYDVPANEFMNMEGRKISGSRNWGVWMLDALSRHDPDPLRYYLTTNMPETRDSDWTWQGYLDRNNNELVANWGNLVNRTLNMTQRYFGGVVPTAAELTARDNDLLEGLQAGFDTVGHFYATCQFRAAVGEVMRLSTLCNQYLEEMSPWTTAKQDMTRTATTLWVMLQAINQLKLLIAPVLPFTSQQLHTLLGEEGTLFGRQTIANFSEATRDHEALLYDGTTALGQWRPVPIPSGRQLPKPTPLFKKLDPSMIEDELQRLGK